MKGMLLSLIILVAGLVAEPVQAQNTKPLPAPGAVLADTTYGTVGDWFVVRNLDGQTFRRADVADRVLFVNFWATWCAPCIKELPAIAALKDAVTDSSVAFLLISIDEDERDVPRFVRKHRLELPVYFRAWEPGASTFAGGMIPATFIVSKDGTIVYQHHGAADWNAEAIRRLLADEARR